MYRVTMKTGHDMTAPSHCQTHRMAVVTGATAVFLRDLCKDMAWYRSLTGGEDVAYAARACACRILQSTRYREIETVVDAVLAHDDGMPEIANKAVLSEIMACYGMAHESERNGTAADFRQNTLVPAIVDDAFQTALPAQEEADAFLASVSHCAGMWDSYTPCTPFQTIVYDAINRIAI